ncbi:MAG TPA: FtsX-like permease family protein [Hyphomicrobiaceae bacterium]|nr:FtsX-like permease family protein [Hyphomicrobiaceae bacterium]
MTLAVSAPKRQVAARRLPLVLSLALREQRNGLKGFYVFIACVALGVAVITGVGALADALRASFERQGETLIGGDLTLARPHRPAEGHERDWLWRQGRVSETATMRAMARRVDGTEQALVEVKGVDDAYPLVGSVALSGGAALADQLRDGGAVVDPLLLERLGVGVGDKLSLGHLEVPIRATIQAEPDRISERLSVGPRVLLSLETLRRSGLVDPGSLVSWRYALKLGADWEAAADRLAAFRKSVKETLPESGFTIRDRRDPSPQVSRTLERLRQFLTLVGLAALLVGGVGVANAVATYLDRRRRVIAAFKSLGAGSRIIFGIHLVQVLLIAGIGIILGCGLGMLIPIGLTTLLGDALPITADITLTGRSLLTAAAYGVLVSLLFSLWPLGRAEQVSTAVLFRDEVAPAPVLPRARVVIMTLIVGALLAAFAIFSSEAQALAFYSCLAVIVVFAVFAGLGALIARVASRSRRPRRPELALAIGNLGAPGGLTRSVVISLGAGLSLLVTVALVDRSVIAELTERLPENSPNFFILDLKREEADAFQTLVRREAPEARIEQAPMLRGRIMRVGARPAEQVKAPPEAQWVLNGDRGLSYAETLPAGSKLVAGQWWPPDWDGEPLVSIEADIAKGLGLKLGDTVTVNVLGRNVTARIANLREVKWESLSLNFVLVFSPNTLKGAPHHLLATLTLAKDAPLASEAKLARDIGRAFPATTAVRVKDAIDAFGVIFGRVMVAVRSAGSVTLLAGALVLAGALATAQRRRIQQAAILKALGATRRRILLSHLVEYAILAILTSFISFLIGTAAAWLAVTQVMDLEFTFSWGAALEALLLATVLVAAFGGFGTWRVLRAPTIPYLRSE